MLLPVIVAQKECGFPEKGEHAVDRVVARNKAVYQCLPGYKYSNGSTERICQKNGKWSGVPLKCIDDINCLEDNKPCQNGGICLESDPSFQCNCEGTGYYGSLCQEADGNWGAWSSFHNCSSTCNEGVIVRRRACDDPKPTTKGKMCEGSAIEIQPCRPKECHSGLYQWCDNKTDMCEQTSEKSFCSVRYNKYKCTCLEGVEELKDKNGNFLRCGDIDECESRTHTCDREHAHCINTDGSYECVCKSGFEGNGKECMDINECEFGNYECDKNAKCYNNPGSYFCACVNGYRSIAVNNTGREGECKESRLMMYRFNVFEEEVRTVSAATGERVSKLIPVPPGLALESGDEAFSCETIYASENGVIVITRLPSSADNDRKPSFRNPIDLSSPNAENAFGGNFHKYICAILAPFWADASFGENSHMWFQVYDDETWPGNLLKGEENKKERKRNKKLLRGVDRLKGLMPETFVPNFVVVFTWERMVPAWSRGSTEEEVTYQTVLATDGTETHAITLYEDGAMTWRPVYVVPDDIVRYPATVGYIIFGRRISKWQHPSSGFYDGDDQNRTSVYLLDMVPFNRTNRIGRDSYNLTPKAHVGPKSFCYKWYLEEKKPEAGVEEASRRCPPSLDHLNLVRDVLWVPSIIEEDRQCFTWSFKVTKDGDIECCYRTVEKYEDSPIVSGISGWDEGAGFFRPGDKSDEKWKKTCCKDAQRDFYCHLYGRRRPATSDMDYLRPKTGFGQSNGAIIGMDGKTFQVKGSGRYQLLRIKNEEGDNIEIIAGYKGKHLYSLALRYSNITFEVHKSSDPGRPRLSCSLNNVACEVFNIYDENLELRIKSLRTGIKSAAMATRTGVFLNVTNREEDLQFTLAVPSNMFSNSSFISGILSPSGSCFSQSLRSSYQRGRAIPCDLKSIATHFNTSISRESFFTEEMDWGDERPGVNKLDKPHSSLDGAIDISESLAKPFPEDVDAKIKARETVPGEYTVTINVTNFDGEVMINGKELKEEQTNELSTTLKKDELNPTAEVSFTNEQGKTKLIHRPVVICDCVEGQGKCEVRNEGKEMENGDLTQKGVCVCEEGFIGLRCEEVENPCSELPCFSRVECEEKKSSPGEIGLVVDGVVVEKRYVCGKCPDSLEEGNGEVCFHENPCLLPFDNPKVHKCSNAKCMNQPTGYTCECLEGFRKVDGKSDMECFDIDECNEDLHTCDQKNGECKNNPGSYSCGCKDGYRLKMDSNQCTDIDECLDKNMPCERRCHNAIGSYKCSCELGYMLNSDGKTCTEINECDDHARGVCSQICVDSEKGQPFTCACHERFTLMEDYRTCLPNFTTSEPPTTERVQTTTEKTTTTATTTARATTTTAATTASVTTTHAPTTLFSTTGLSDLFPPGWDFIDPNADEYTRLFQTLRRYLYLQLLNSSEFRLHVETDKEKARQLIEALARLLAHAQTGRVLAYFLAVTDQGLYEDWEVDRDCPILSEKLFESSEFSILSVLQTMDGHWDSVNTAIDVYGLLPIVHILEVDFSLITHLKTLPSRRIGRTGLDANTNFKDTIGIKQIPTLVDHLKRLKPCKEYIDMIMGTTTLRTTTTSRKRKTFVTTRETATAEVTSPLHINRLPEPPVLLITAMVILALLVFIFIICYTRFCLTWRRHRRHRMKIKQQKKLKEMQKMKSWPRYVDTTLEMHRHPKFKVKVKPIGVI